MRFCECASRQQPVLRIGCRTQSLRLFIYGIRMYSSKNRGDSAKPHKIKGGMGSGSNASRIAFTDMAVMEA